MNQYYVICIPSTLSVHFYLLLALRCRKNVYVDFCNLGYVMASKQDRRFTSCPPNTTFAALCDNDRNIFVYRSDVPLDSTLKNRQSGKIIRKVAKQHVITLKEPGPILGFAVNNSHIFVLKSNALFTVKLWVFPQSLPCITTFTVCSTLIKCSLSAELLSAFGVFQHSLSERNAGQCCESVSD